MLFENVLRVLAHETKKIEEVEDGDDEEEKRSDILCSTSNT